MFNATEFVYDGVFSNMYGLKIASFNSNALEETSYIEPEIQTVKSAKSKRFDFVDLTYEAPPTYQFSVVSESVIQDDVLRDILMWLDSRRGFKPLIIMQPDLDGATYQCIFTVTSLIYHAGYCVGLNLSATFDSMYTYGSPTVKRLQSGIYKDAELIIYNHSDTVDEYTYPIIEFKNAVGSDFLKITNETDNTSRVFELKNIADNQNIVVDNERKIISSSSNDANLLSNFNRNWLRLVRGENKLKITMSGEIKITCPYYMRIRF